MNPERSHRLSQLLQAAASRAQEARARFLDEACGADTALRAEVESLLAALDAAPSFLDASSRRFT